MTGGYVEPSGEASDLAEAEIAAAAEALGGRVVRTADRAVLGLVAVELPTPDDLVRLAGRLALARRVLAEVGPKEPVTSAVRALALPDRTAAVRRIGQPSGPADALVRAVGAEFVRAGGAIDLVRPRLKLWLGSSASGTSSVLLREVAEVDRGSFARRRMPLLPFRRPVSLPPKLARAAVNLARIRPGERVLDPFLGTGALLAEAALLGAEVYGIDRDPAMVRGALANFAHLGVAARHLVQGDAREVAFSDGPVRFAAVVTDPPYGRSSAAGGEAPAALLRAVLGRWQGSVDGPGRIVVVTPGGPVALDPPWQEELRLPVRVHRSLTREFRRYGRRS